ncbi:winged helix-turn-helix domain-containing protein [Halobacteriaceae archaeon GCM10025711]
MVEPAELDELHWAIIEHLREGRCTPSFLAEETGESRQLISQRLRDLVMAGYVEKIHTGLYELRNDPGNNS